MVACGNYMHRFSVSKNMKKNNNDKRRKEVVSGKVVAHLWLALIIKESKITVERDRVVTTLHTIKHHVSFWWKPCRYGLKYTSPRTLQGYFPTLKMVLYSVHFSNEQVKVYNLSLLLSWIAKLITCCLEA